MIWTPDPAVHSPPRYRRACNYEAFVPDSVAGWQPTLEGDLAMVVLDAERRVQALNALAVPALGPLARLLLRTESIASSKVEGMQADVRSIARAEARQEVGATIGPEAQEVLANIDAMQLAIEDTARAEQLSVAQLCRIHEALLARAVGHARHAGRVRVEQNWIGGNDYNPCGADFVPPTPEHVGPLLDDLVSFCAEESMPPVVQAALAHAQFETIHPFVDGNGRTGRALIHVLLRRRGTTPNYVPPISVVLAAERERYIVGLEAFREGDVSGWIEHFAVATARAADLAGTYLQRVRELQQVWRDQLVHAAGPRSDAAAWKVVDALPAHPIVSIPVAVAATGRTRPAVAQAFEQLVAADVLAPLSESRRNRSFEAVGLLDLLEELEASVSQRR